MKRFLLTLPLFVLVAVAAAPVPAFAIVGLPGSFGGRITKIEPCLFPPGGILVSLVSSRTETLGLSQDYLFTPPPLTLVSSPQAPLPLIGGQALGFADFPMVCQSLLRTVLFFSVFSFVPATHMTAVGFSLPGPIGDVPSV